MIKLKTPRELQIMREAGKITGDCFERVQENVKPGVTTRDLNRIADEFIRSCHAEAAFKGYKGFPASICSSVNEEIVHGIPGDRVLQEGDIVSIDIGVRYRNYHGDAAYTFPVGRVAPNAERLLEAGKTALLRGIEQVRPNARLSRVSRAIFDYGTSMGYGIVDKYVGHGIGSKMHEEPQVPNFVIDPADQVDCILKPGMVIAIEPMLNEGTKDVEVLPDGWTAVTADRGLSVHFEHTVAVTRDGYEVLTQWSGHRIGSCDRMIG